MLATPHSKFIHHHIFHIIFCFLNLLCLFLTHTFLAYFVLSILFLVFCFSLLSMDFLLSFSPYLFLFFAPLRFLEPIYRFSPAQTTKNANHFLWLNFLLHLGKSINSMHEQSDSRSLSDSLDNIPSNVFGPEGLVTRFTLPLSYGRKEARQKRVG